MREAKFILPFVSVSKAHDYARSELLKAFGGYTMHVVSGAWQDGDGNAISDHSMQYIVAMSGGFYKFRAIAIKAGRMAGQQAVYIVSPTGEAEIVDLIVPGYTAEAYAYELATKPAEKEQEPRRPQVDEVWKTRDGKNKVLVTDRLNRNIFGRVIKGPYASPIAQLAFQPDGSYNTEHDGHRIEHYIDLVEYVTTI